MASTGKMPKKQQAPPPGQRKISAFFSPKPGSTTPGPATTPASASVKLAPSPATAPPQSAPPAAVQPKQVETTPVVPAAQPGPGKELVGRRVKVWWPLDKAWYAGDIQAFNPESGKHEVAYEDGDLEWVHLPSEKYKLAEPRTEGSSQGNKPSKATGTAAKGGAPQDMSALEDDVGPAVAADAAAPAKGEGATTNRPARRRLVQGASKKPAAKTKMALGDSDSDDAETGEESGSEFEAGDESGSDDMSVDLEYEKSEGGGGSDSDDSDASDEGQGAGTKRKRAKAPVKTPAAKKVATPATAGTTTRPTPGTAFTPGSVHTPGMRTPGSGPPRPTPTPSSGARAKAQQAFDVTPGGTAGKPSVTNVVHGVETRLNSDDAQRFLARMAERFSFLNPANIKDKAGRRPSDPLYDPSTLFIPPGWFKEKKVSEGQQQWWGFKAAHFDSVLLFKMGKFYEMFEMDAYVGVDVLGLQFMKGEQPHAGFPEIRYHEMAEALARAGYKVVVVEQTETPDQLAKRNDDRRKQGLKLANVVAREKVAVLSKGTLIDAEMVASKLDPSYVMAVAELPVPADAPPHARTLVTLMGVAAVDVASGHMVVGEFLDDETRSSLRTHLATYQPVELVLPGQSLTTSTPTTSLGAPSSVGGSGGVGGVDGTTQRVLKGSLRDPRVNVSRRTQWRPERALQLIQERRYFSGKTAGGASTGGLGGAAGPAVAAAAASHPGFASFPPALQTYAVAWRAAQDAADRGPNEESSEGGGSAVGPDVAPGRGAAALSAFYGLLEFLKDALLDAAVVPQGRLDALPVLERQAGGAAGHADASPLGSDEPTHMLMNGAALENLEILENTDGGTAGSLLSVLDQCTTPFGRRRLRQWLGRPLYRAEQIVRRQDAVAVLSGPASDAVGAARKLLAGVSDVERAVARLFASTVPGGRDAANVVLYEDQAKRKVKALTTALKDVGALARAAGVVRTALQGAHDEGVDSVLLSALTEADKWGQVQGCLDTLNAATDWKQAESTGRVVPAEGVDEEYDTALQAIQDAEEALAEYLSEARKLVTGAGPREVVYVSMNKDSHVIETPDKAQVPKSFLLVGQKKGFKRWSTPALQQLTADLAEAESTKETALSNILQGLVVRFCEERPLWTWAVDAVADLDALLSLAGHAMSGGVDGPMCRPTILPATSDTPPVLHAKGLRHPAGLPGRCGAFVPNDILLGGTDTPSFILLSGPNMGGKSTLLRQACLSAVLAQVGACVPADSLTLTPVDAMFVRMGAKDHIMTGQSTFFVELSETAAMLHKATRRSLVALDELGRGTATLDGAAIAWAVLQHMAHGVGCRGVFATHYHQLSHEFSNDARVAVMHMACAVGGRSEEEQDSAEDAMQVDQTADKEPEVPEVTFLYKLTPGACPKSYGTNVARLAGLPRSAVCRAAVVSASTEGEARAVAASARAGDGMDVDTGAAGAQLATVTAQCVASLRQALEAEQAGPALLAAQTAAQQAVATH